MALSNPMNPSPRRGEQEEEEASAAAAGGDEPPAAAASSPQRVSSSKKSLESLLADLLIAMGATIAAASHVTPVLSSLYSLASLLWVVPIPAPKAATCRRQASEAATIEGGDVYEATKSALYEGSLFTTLAKLLLHQVAPDWLACFPSGAPRWLFDEFFLQAPVTEALFELAPSLSSDHLRVEDTEDELDGSAVVLLEICLIEKEGVKEMALAFGRHFQALRLAEGKQTQGWSNNRRKIGQATWLQMDKQIAQLLASVPDRAGFKAASSLQSPSFFQLIVKQLVAAIEEHQEEMRLQSMTLEEASADGLFTFSGEVIVKLCRRGHADVVASVLVPKLFQQVLHNFGNFSREVNEGEKDTPHLTWESIKHISERSYWAAVTVAIKDSHAMEKWVEALLRDMADKRIDDLQAYCILLTLFSDLLSQQHIMIRMVFIEKCLFSKILPTRCLKWVLDFAVLQSPPSTVDMQNTSKKREKHLEVDVVQRLAHVWSSNKFIRSAPILKQAYLTAAVGMCVRAMDKEDMEHCDNLMKSLLEGVSHRLESPLPQVRQMAKRVALAFSLVLNPANPLFLDDGDEIGDLDDWDGLHLIGNPSQTREPLEQPGVAAITSSVLDGSKFTDDKPGKAHVDPSLKAAATAADVDKHERRRQIRERRERMALEEDDPDAVVNLGEDSFNNSAWLDEHGGDGTESDSGSEEGSPLRPYDMSDDDSELERRKLPLHLSDCITSLRKGDDPNAVENALQVAEQLVRAMPEELDNAAADLSSALVHVRCSTVEGEEDTAEDKRHGALVALLASSPLASVGVLTRELYSPHVDVSQRLLILDVMADGARELAGTRDQSSGRRGQQRGLVTELLGASHQNAWYEPGHHQNLKGSGPWVEVPALMPGTSMVSWAHRYERELPARKGDHKLGKVTRKWAPRSMQLRKERWQQQMGTGSAQAGLEAGKNRFAPVAMAFMLPIMRDHDKKTHGVDLLGPDFIVLGKLVHTLGVFMECLLLQPEAAVLGVALLDLLHSRGISKHEEAYVRRAALYAASQVIQSLHPSQVASAVTGGDETIAKGLDWIREWALGIAENDVDSETSTMAIACIEMHSEMVLQAMRAIQSLPSKRQSQILIHTESSQGPLIFPF
ncbi:unnamed protein product [Sphagnum compactum]